MKTKFLVGLLALLTCGSLFCIAQDGAQSSSAKPTAAEKKTSTTKRANRLPTNYAKLGLSEAQRDKIYSVQHSFADQIDALEAQIDALKQKRDKEFDAVLSADQRKTLADLTTAAKESKAKSKKSETEKKPESTKPESTSAAKSDPK
jgi:hypothetical protein